MRPDGAGVKQRQRVVDSGVDIDDQGLGGFGHGVSLSPGCVRKDLELDFWGASDGGFRALASQERLRRVEAIHRDEFFRAASAVAEFNLEALVLRPTFRQKFGDVSLEPDDRRSEAAKPADGGVPAQGHLQGYRRRSGLPGKDGELEASRRPHTQP